jgi:programmed cell death 6-interacting protein
MFVIPLKQSSPSSLTEPLTNYLSETSQLTPSSISSIETLTTLRSLAVPKGTATHTSTASTSSSSSYKTDLHKYHAALLTCESRGFPLVDTPSLHSLSLTWNCALTDTHACTRKNLRYDRLGVLWNAAAVECHLAAVQERGTETGLKLACNGFQVSAGMFTALKALLTDASNPNNNYPTTLDFHADTLDMVVSIMLAQAQACVYEKAVASRRDGGGVKPGVLSKIASSCNQFYTSALLKAMAPALSSKLDSSRANHLNSRKLTYAGASEYWEAVSLQEAASQSGRGYGLEISRLVSAENFCEQSLLFGKKIGLDVAASEQLLQLIQQRKETAVDDNNKIYMEIVPNVNQLTTIKPATLVKALPLPETMTKLSESDGMQFLKDILPKEARNARDKLEKRMLEIVDESISKVGNASDAARSALKRINLPMSIEANNAGDTIPDTTWQVVTKAQSKNPGALLSSSLSSTDGNSQKVSKLLAAAESALNQQLGTDNAFKASNPGYASRVSLVEQQNEYRKDIDYYKEMLWKADKSDEVVRQNLQSDATRNAIVMLGKSRLDFDKEMPKRDAASGPSTTPAIDTTLLSTKLRDLSMLMSVRDAALSHLIQSTKAVDFLSVLGELSDSKDYNKIADDEMSKFDEVRIDIDNNIEEQTGLLRIIFEENAKFVAARSVDAVTQQREAYFLKVENAVATFESLHKQVAEGRAFYESIMKRVEELSQTCLDQHVMVGVMHSDWLEEQQSRNRTISQEASDAEFAARLANECNFSQDDAAAARAAQEIADAEFAAEMAREDQAEIVAGRQQAEAEKQKKKADEELLAEERKSGGAGWMAGWFGGGSATTKTETEGGSALSQPLTRDEYPAAGGGSGGGGGGGGGGDGGFPGSGAQRGGGYAPPVDTGDAPPLPAYQPPSFSPTSGNIAAPPPAFGSWIPQPPPMPPPPAAGGPVHADSNKVTTLAEMGFDIEKVKKALADHNNDEESALNQLISE